MMKIKRVALVLLQDFWFIGLAGAGLMFQMGWAWNVFLFTFWFLFVSVFIFSASLYSEKSKDMVRKYNPERFTRCIWGWWNKLTAFGTGCFIAAFGHYFMAAMWVILWGLDEICYDRVAELRAEIARESEPKE